MKIIKDYLFLRITLVLAVLPVISCSVGRTPANSLEEAERILKLAREAVYKGIKFKDIKSIRIEKTSAGTTTMPVSTMWKGILGKPTEASSSEGKETQIIGDTKIKIQFPDKIKKVSHQHVPLPKKIEGEDEELNSLLKEYHTLLEQNSKEPISSDIGRIEMILNGEKADFNYGMSGLFSGPSFTIVIGAPFMPEDFHKKNKSIKENSLKGTEIDRQTRESELVRQSLWIDLFPLLLQMPWDSPVKWGLPVKFKYVGKADVNGKRANVLELVSLGKIPGRTKESKAQVKLFFDEESDLLLLITQKTSSGGGTWETKYRFSNYEIIDGLKVAKKINIESNLPIEDENEKIMKETTIKKLEINPTFSYKDFKLN